mmetsp:Transcript_148841/g.414696  ORF Transcript_148841/g.414696 Transcript_148841/m.414696 type:complete len:459 (+) Transcript_148841:95-1471(+)
MLAAGSRRGADTGAAANPSVDPECLGQHRSSSSSSSNVTCPDAHVRVYTRWPAKSRFVCGGRCITGGEDECPVRCLGGISCANLAAWLCLLLPCGVYFAVVLPHMMRQWTPTPPFLLPVASVSLFIVTVALLLATCCSDPGIIPRRRLVLATGSHARVTALLGHDLLGAEGLEPTGDALSDAEKMVPDGLRQRGYRWCHTCQIVRPPRASHCRDCDHCVLRFDHHCPFVNNCIGQRNYHFFIGFTTAAVLLAAIVLPALLWSLTLPGGRFVARRDSRLKGGAGAQDDAAQLSAMALVWLRMGAIVGCLSVATTALLLVGLWLYHVWLVLMGQTTKEHVMRRRRNLDVTSEPTLCAPRGPRLFDPRAWVRAAVLDGQQPAVAAGSSVAAVASAPLGIAPGKKSRLMTLLGDLPRRPSPLPPWSAGASQHGDQGLQGDRVSGGGTGTHAKDSDCDMAIDV